MPFLRKMWCALLHEVIWRPVFITSRNHTVHLRQVFKQLQVGEYLQWHVEATYVELYNESFRDLAEPCTAPADISIYEQQCALLLAFSKYILFLEMFTSPFLFTSTLK